MAANNKLSIRIIDHLSIIEDPRIRKVKHPLINILFIGMVASLCGAEDFVAMAEFGEARKDWFAKFLDLSNGIPSHDRFNSVFSLLKPEFVEASFRSWIEAFQGEFREKFIAIDGKTLRGSFDKATGKSALHMVHAWGRENGMCLGQVITDDKSNEITAIPKLLEALEIKGCVITIDAMGCQRDIAQKIVEADGDYCLAVKANQGNLHADITNHIAEQMKDKFARVKISRHETDDEGHGRVEKRSYYVLPIPKKFEEAEKWAGLKAIGVAISETVRDEKITNQVRYYIMSRNLKAQEFADAARGNWGIENQLHWQLDVSYQEDKCRVRSGHADANFAILRRLTLNILKANKTSKVGIKNKRLRAGWDLAYCELVLRG
jgi:predicted transposase YbfD/YdcC